MDKKNKIQYILDQYLKFKKSSSSSDNYHEKFWGDHNHSDNNLNDFEASKEIDQLFSNIQSRDNSIEPEYKFNKLSERIDFEENTTFATPPLKTKYLTLRKIAAVFLPVAVIASFFIYFLVQNNETDVQMVASTLNGSKTKLVLEDGTQVWLNGESELKFPSTFKNKDTRTVILTGEAFFDVTKNPKKPFEVYAKGYKVNVLGTSFNVKAYPEDEKIEATLEHGKVDIEKFTNKDKKETRKVVSLKPNQTIVIYDDEIVEQQKNIVKETARQEKSKVREEKLEERKMILIENSDLSPYISWKDNELTFKNKPLKDVATDLERWYNIKIKLANEELNNIKFTATFTTETAEQAIYAICVASEINYEINKNEVILTIKDN